METETEKTKSAWQYMSKDIPRGRKLMLKRKDRIFAGVFLSGSGNGYYFIADMGSSQQPRKADYWAEIPPSFLIEPTPIFNEDQEN